MIHLIQKVNDFIGCYCEELWKKDADAITQLFQLNSWGLPSSFIYVACLPVGRYWLWGKTPGGHKILLLGAETFGCHYFERCFILSAMRLYKVSFVKPPSEIIESGIKSITSKNNLLLLSM